MQFCSRCGKQLEEGQLCDCSTNVQSSGVVDTTTSGAQDFWALAKKRIGLDEPEKITGNKYERDMKIIPDNVRPSENEVHVRQYDIAVLRNLLRFERAEGRLQITNKRVILRAAGRSVGGRTIMQQEFNIDEIAGLEAIRNYRFNGLYLILGCLLVFLAGCAGFFISGFSAMLGEIPKTLGPVLGIGGLLPFFLLDRRLLLKLLCLGLSLGYFAFVSMAPLKNPTMFDGFFMFLSILLTIFCLGLFCLKPNLLIMIKNKAATAPVTLMRTKRFWRIFQSSDSAAAGFSEVIPTPETENAILEIGAIIHDIQTLGDLGLQKWVK